VALTTIGSFGCKTSRISLNEHTAANPRHAVTGSSAVISTMNDKADTSATAKATADITLTAAIDELEAEPTDSLPPPPIELDDTPAIPTGPTAPIALEQVVDAIYQSYPLLEIARLERNVRSGDNLSAQGEFDLKLKADSENTPEGFYQTYRNGMGFDQPLMSGGSVFGGYRIGRGDFEPWYLERQTNDGGEFKLGMSVPLWQNRNIDERRATLWRTAYGRDLVEPEIRTQMLLFIRDGSIAYWEWVGAGRQYHYAEQLLELAQDRDQQLRRQVEVGKKPESDLTDNERLIVSRRVKQLDALRKLQTSAAKLSLFLRMPDGLPFVPTPELLPSEFPTPQPVERTLLDQDIAFALQRRPELEAFDVSRQMLQVELSQAQNLLQPSLDAVVSGDQDVGGLTSSKGDKQPFELDAGIYFSVPVQRRKAWGKIASLEGKLAQLNAKRQFMSDKISVEVQAAIIALDTAFQAISQAHDAVRLNEEMERYELIRLDQGDSDFLRLNLREQATFDAKVTEVEAYVRYYEAQADYRAAIAFEIPTMTTP